MFETKVLDSYEKMITRKFIDLFEVKNLASQHFYRTLYISAKNGICYITGKILS